MINRFGLTLCLILTSSISSADTFSTAKGLFGSSWQTVPEEKLFKGARSFELPNGTGILSLQLVGKDDVVLKPSADGQTRVRIIGGSSISEDNLSPLLNSIQVTYFGTQVTFDQGSFNHHCVRTNWSVSRGSRGDCLIRAIVELPEGSATIVQVKTERLNHLDKPVSKTEFLTALPGVPHFEKPAFIEQYVSKRPNENFSSQELKFIMDQPSNFAVGELLPKILPYTDDLRVHDVVMILERASLGDRLEAFKAMAPKTLRDERPMLQDVVKEKLMLMERGEAMAALLNSFSN